MSLFASFRKHRLRALGVALVGGVIVAAASTERGRDLGQRAWRRVAAAARTLRDRLGRRDEVGATDEDATSTTRPAVDARVEQEHARERGAEGRAWASAHARRPHAAAAPESEGLRNAAMRRSQRHV
jgi:hypothetical protein